MFTFEPYTHLFASASLLSLSLSPYHLRSIKNLEQSQWFHAAGIGSSNTKYDGNKGQSENRSITIPPKADRSQRKINSVIIPVCLTNINTHQIDCSYISVCVCVYVYAYALNVTQCKYAGVWRASICVVVIFSISIRLLCFYGYGKYGNRGSNKSLQPYTFRLIKQWQYQNKRQSFNIFTTCNDDPSLFVAR